uniref:Uncharacterized protein n=1 Tax=Trichuris muris TaxID=70415 RepID=A0A5S6QBH4_TRIMR
MNHIEKWANHHKLVNENCGRRQLSTKNFPHMATVDPPLPTSLFIYLGYAMWSQCYIFNKSQFVHSRLTYSPTY